MDINLDTQLDELQLQYGEMDAGSFLDRPAVRLNGLVLLPEIVLQDGGMETWIAAEGPAYCGMAFRVQDAANFELAYAQPHTSGGWDALQYDPVFNGSNTWQLYHGPGYQHAAEIPNSDWFRLRILFQGQRALVSLDDQPPLRIDGLAHALSQGRLGLWSYLPAWFSGFSILSDAHLPERPAALETLPAALVREWQVDDLGPVRCEPGGFLNLNRYLLVRPEPAVLRYRFLAECRQDLRFSFGFSDHLTLLLDGAPVFEGSNIYHSTTKWHERGYAARSMYAVSTAIERGIHEITARLSVSEPYGWGLMMTVEGKALHSLRWI